VRPDDVLERHRYALTAILTAWFLAVRPPIGDGHHDEAVYDLVGVDRRIPGPDPGRAGKPRWGSLARWAACISAWWPTRSTTGPTWRKRVVALLAGFIPGDGGRDGAIRRAVVAHAAGGSAM
jgi:hypothetical protein